MTVSVDFVGEVIVVIEMVVQADGVVPVYKYTNYFQISNDYRYEKRMTLLSLSSLPDQQSVISPVE